MVPRYYIAFAPLTLVYILLSFYVGYRIWQYFFIRFKKLSFKTYALIYTALTLSYPGSRILRTNITELAYVILNWLGLYFMAVFFFMIIIIGSVDLLSIFITPLRKKKPLNYKISTVIISIIILLLGYGRWNAERPRIRNYEVVIPKTSPIDSLKIVMVSDIHLNRVFNLNRLEQMVETVKDLNSDLILLTGDTIDPDINIYEDPEISQTLSQLNAKYGVYAVLGNHEYYSYVEEDIQHFEEGQMRVLRDETVKINDSFYLVGRDELYRKYFLPPERKELSTLLTGIDFSYPVIVLDHQPVDLEQSEKLGVDLQLSGHTHGGQFFPFHLITSTLYDITWGYQKRGQLHIIVSSGFGLTGPPIRIGTYPEVSIINVLFNEL